MREEITPHIIFDMRSHDVTIGGHIVLAGRLYHVKSEHGPAADQDALDHLRGRQVKNTARQISDNNGKGHTGQGKDDRTNHISPEDPTVGFIIGHESAKQEKPPIVAKALGLGVMMNLSN